MCTCLFTVASPCFVPQENTNIEEAVRCLVEHILRNEENPLIERDPGALVLSGYGNTRKDQLSCSSCFKW